MLKFLVVATSLSLFVVSVFFCLSPRIGFEATDGAALPDGMVPSTWNEPSYLFGYDDFHRGIHLRWLELRVRIHESGQPTEWKFENFQPYKLAFSTIPPILAILIGVAGLKVLALKNSKPAIPTSDRRS